MQEYHEENDQNEEIHIENQINVHSETNNSDTRKCEYCGNECKVNDTFCAKCGERLDFKPSLIYEDYRRDLKKSDEDEEISRFIGANYDFYLKKFKVQDVSESNLTWNWPAFLVPVYWFAYRKLYVHAAIIVAITFVLGFLEGFGTLLGLALSIYIGLNSNAFYRNYVQRHIDEVKELGDEDRQKYYNANGGTSTLAVIITLTITFFITLFRSI